MIITKCFRSFAANLLVVLSLLVVAGVNNQATCADEQEKLEEFPISDSDREHWSFAPLVKPLIPKVRDASWARTPIDAFIIAAMEAKGISLGVSADPATLQRRLYFDLVGRPPTIDELARNSNTDRETWYEEQVDRLLASPMYGERWGQHWLDLARFAQTDGFEHDRIRPAAWQYRDWVLDAFNQDLSFDRFVAFQLAGDVVDNGSQRVATAFCLAGPDMTDVNDQIERRHNLLNEMTSTVGSVFLGLQFGCAQCHDHKYDPISQADFYRLRAVFESSVPVLKRDEPYNLLSIQDNVPAPRLWKRGDHRQPGIELSPAFPRIADPANHSQRIQDSRSARSLLVSWMTDSSNPLTARVIVNRVWQHHFGKGIFSETSDAGLISSEPTHPQLLDWLACDFRETGWSIKRLHRLIVCSATYRQTSRLSTGDHTWSDRFAADTENQLYSRFPRKRLEGEAIRDAMLTVSGLINYQRGGTGVMPPLPDEMLKTLLKGHWSTSAQEADHYRRSFYLFARRNLRYPLFDTFDRPDANASCPQRGRSTTALQSLQMINSEFSLIAAQNFARELINSPSDSDSGTNRGRQWIENAVHRAYSRPAQVDEITALSNFLVTQAREIESNREKQSPSVRLPASKFDGIISTSEYAALVDLCLAIMNANEFIYVD